MSLVEDPWQATAACAGKHPARWLARKSGEYSRPAAMSLHVACTPTPYHLW